MSVRLYVEGGGDNNANLTTLCRRGFTLFLQKSGLFEGKMPRVVVCGGRKQAYDDFCTAAKKGETALLLVDSEEAVKDKDAWEHVRQREGDKWSRPDGVKDDQLHFMVQTMEAWFYADRDALAAFYGKGFRSNALSARTGPESIPKCDLYEGLEAATRACQKRTYSKSSHSFVILASLDPAKVRDKCRYADRFLTALASYCH